MTLSRLQADQLNTWSDNHAPHIAQGALVRFAKAPAAAVAPDAPAGSFAAWLAHRTLQTLRQAGMQMRPRSRAWPQVLPLGELFRPKAANGLRASERSLPDRQISGLSPSGSRDLRRDLRDQPRTAPPSRGTLRERDAQPPPLTLSSDRYANRWPTPSQHARRLAEERFHLLLHCGDLR